MGRVDVHVEITGQACHSSDPSKGRNAIEGACQFMRYMADVPLPEADPDLGKPTLTPTFITSWPTASHTVPSHCRLVLDRRLIPGEEIAQALDDLTACGQRVEGFEVKVEGGRFNYPSKTALAAPLAQIALAALEAEGAEPRTHYWRSTLDAGFFSRQGVDVIQFGPGDYSMAHTDDEMIALADVELAARVYVRILETMLH
jgi:acetylornithine deacetylase/succinyl-diaminopimelate desuccinylase-like protein